MSEDKKEKKEVQAATLADIIARKAERIAERERAKQIAVPSMGMTLSFEHPGDRAALEMLDEVTMSDATAGLYDAYVLMIYRCSPMFHADALKEDVKDPTDIVRAVMNINDVMTVGGELAEYLGIIESKKIKN